MKLREAAVRIMGLKLRVDSRIHLIGLLMVIKLLGEQAFDPVTERTIWRYRSKMKELKDLGIDPDRVEL